MEIKQRLREHINFVRDMSEKFLAAFQTPDQWVHQVAPGVNHALWFAGHMGMADSYFMSLVTGAKAPERQGYKEKFGMGSKPTNRAADYPPASEVLAYMREQRSALLAALDRLSETDLARPAPAGAPPFLKDVAAILEFVPIHEALHAGQLSQTRRALGNPPLF